MAILFRIILIIASIASIGAFPLLKCETCVRNRGGSFVFPSDGSKPICVKWGEDYPNIPIADVVYPGGKCSSPSTSTFPTSTTTASPFAGDKINPWNVVACLLSVLVCFLILATARCLYIWIKPLDPNASCLPWKKRNHRPQPSVIIPTTIPRPMQEQGVPLVQGPSVSQPATTPTVQSVIRALCILQKFSDTIQQPNV